MDTYIYKLRGAIYINLTNRCTNNCDFCLRNTHDGVGGYDLMLGKEPSADDIIKELNKEKDVEKVIFCGLGEPTTRLDVLLRVAKYLKSRNSYIRVNTNGQGSAYAKSNIAKRLKGLVDTVSVSLNAPSAFEYQEICHSIYGEKAYEYLLDFVKNCLAEGIVTVLSVVDIVGEKKVTECKAIAERVGAKFRIRKYVE